jgi:RimK family alpha-L-glutamate ligase
MLKSSPLKSLIVASQSRELYSTSRFLYEGEKLKLKTIYLNPYDSSLLINFHNKKPNINKSSLDTLYLHRTTGVNFDDFDLVISSHYEAMGMKVSNPINATRLMRNKDEQALFMKTQNIPSIPSFVFRGKPTSQIIEEISRNLNTSKFVLKMSRGNKGVGVNFINGIQSIQSLLETFHAMKDQKMLIQPLIEHQREWRVFVIKNEIMAVVEKKINASDFRGNAERAKPKLIKKIPRELSELAIDAFSKSGLDYAGIDIIEPSNGDQNLVCEINSIAGFEQIESLSKINIAKEIIIRI